MIGKRIELEAAYLGFTANKGGMKLCFEIGERFLSEAAMVIATEGFRLTMTIEVHEAEIIGQKAEE